MLERVATIVVFALAIYLAVGLLVAVPMVVRGVERWDPQARGGSWGFRLLILPGSVALWPILLRRWLAGDLPEERSPHRQAARAQERV